MMEENMKLKPTTNSMLLTVEKRNILGDINEIFLALQ
jgi:hypothetical protein